MQASTNCAEEALRTHARTKCNIPNVICNIPNVIREPAVKTAEKSRAAAKGHKQMATNKMASEASDADALSLRLKPKDLQLELFREISPYRTAIYPHLYV